MTDMSGLPRKAACIGGGVIGAGWVARLLLAGVDVTVHDPSADAERVVREVLANAERAVAALVSAPLPRRGALRFAASVEEAVADAGFIQESVPERIELKRRVLAAIDAAAPADALIGSSTSGLLPSDLQSDMTHPERLVVAHPFNPVYLLPLVELVAGSRTTTATMDRAVALYTGLGMKPVVIRREIEAFVGDRLLEALWREALWLVNDDVASVEEIDDIIRLSFGLRWAQMGLFQTYRIAGGEAGMRHFLAQFGPALKWPWTKLMDVPDLDEALVEKIAAQSDAQAAGLGVRELERVRDDNLVAIMRALAAQRGGEGWGAGALVRAQESRLNAAARSETPDATPLCLTQGAVREAWIDYNGHMTESRYLQVFGETTDALLALIGAGSDYVADGHSYYTVETHIRHLGEMKLAEGYRVTTQVLGADPKRIRILHSMLRQDGKIAATAEQMLLHVDSRASRAVPAAAAVLQAVASIARSHRALPVPPEAGRGISPLGIGNQLLSQPAR